MYITHRQNYSIAEFIIAVVEIKSVSDDELSVARLTRVFFKNDDRSLWKWLQIVETYIKMMRRV